MAYLEANYGGGIHKGVDMLWNPSNHRVLADHDFDALAQLGVLPWKFVQTSVMPYHPLPSFTPVLACLFKESAKH